MTAGDPLPDRRALIDRIAAANAAGAAAHARVLAAQDPTWGTDVFELAGGVAVLCGPGLYINRAIGIGLGGCTVSPDDLAELERRSAAVGVPASIDVVPTTDSRLLALAAERGYALERMLTFHVRAVRPGDHERSSPDPAIVVRRAEGDLLDTWQEVSAAGFDVGDGSRAARPATRSERPRPPSTAARSCWPRAPTTVGRSGAPTCTSWAASPSSAG